MSQTIYARVPDQTKEAVDGYAGERGLTLASSVTQLLDRGLQAAGDEASVATLQDRVAEQGAELEAMRERERATSSAYRALGQRTTQPVGSCPSCATRISGQDLLVSGQCPSCGASLTPLLGIGTDGAIGKGGLNDADLKILLGALGVLLGIALLSQGGG
jgi:hypothetical protein